jgi:Ca2+-binding EF-hand superfamily protein
MSGRRRKSSKSRIQDRANAGRVAVGLASKRAPSKRRSQTPSQSLLNASPRLCDQDEVAGLSEVPVVPQAVKLMRDAAEQFFAADVDNSGSLTMDEFRRLVVPTTTPLTDDEVTILFERCDLDGSGTISLDEFFMFLLGYVQSQTGVGLDAIFRRYDQKGTDGTLDAAEFQHAAEDLGFGAISHDLFAELDPSGSGTVDGSELLSALKLRGASREAKRFILGLSYEAEHAAVVLETRTWQLTTESYEALRLQLGALLAAHEPPARISDLFCAMTCGANGTLSEAQLGRALERIGMIAVRREKALVRGLFEQMDTDGSGVIGQRDLYAWMRGAEAKRDRAQRLTLRKPAPRDIEWTPETLRKALQLALSHAAIGPVDLLRAWDSSANDGAISRHEVSGTRRVLESSPLPYSCLTSSVTDVCFSSLAIPQFISHVKKVVDDEALWEEELRDVASHTFKLVSAGDHTMIGVTEFSNWLTVGWLRLREEAKQNPAADPWSRERRRFCHK